MFFDGKILIDEKFAEWACGFSGFDGGNLSGAIWFCGIEYGGGWDEKQVKDDIEKGAKEVPYMEKPEERQGFILGRKMQFNRGIVKLYSSIIGKPTDRYMEVFEKMSVFGKDSDTLKLNLYPLPFHDISDDLWKEWHYNITGFPSKPIYQSWCQLYRFPVFKDWVTKHSPKAIICTGTTFKREFLMAFSGIKDIFKRQFKKEDFLEHKKSLYWHEINSGKSVLFVIPFLGPGGIMSDNELRDFGSKINEIATKLFGASWHKEYQLD